jgi:pyruvate dehydrogenase E2 component (dihydrolipoamide acetyltransferase)
VAEDGRQKRSILGALAKASIPIKAVFMRDDAVIPSQHALNLPFNVACHIMPGSGHLPHWREPDSILGLIGAA